MHPACLGGPAVTQPPDVVPTDEPTATSISLDTPVQGGYVLHGQVRLFGSTVAGNMEKWMGPSPEDIVVEPGPPSIERVTQTLRDTRGEWVSPKAMGHSVGPCSQLHRDGDHQRRT